MTKYNHLKLDIKSNLDIFTSAILGCAASTIIAPDSYIKTTIIFILFTLSIWVCSSYNKLVKNITDNNIYRYIHIIYAVIFGVLFSQYFNNDANTTKYIIIITCLVMHLILYKKLKIE